MSADSCRMRVIEGVRMVGLVHVGELLRMDGYSLLVSVWRFVVDGFTGKGESDVWVVRAGTWQPGNLHWKQNGLPLIVNIMQIASGFFLSTLHTFIFIVSTTPLPPCFCLIFSSFFITELKVYGIFSICSWLSCSQIRTQYSHSSLLVLLASILSCPSRT